MARTKDRYVLCSGEGEFFFLRSSARRLAVADERRADRLTFSVSALLHSDRAKGVHTVPGRCVILSGRGRTADQRARPGLPRAVRGGGGGEEAHHLSNAAGYSKEGRGRPGARLVHSAGGFQVAGAARACAGFGGGRREDGKTGALRIWPATSHPMTFARALSSDANHILHPTLAGALAPTNERARCQCQCQCQLSSH